MKKFLHASCLVIIIAGSFYLNFIHNRATSEHISALKEESNYAVFSGRDVYEYHRSTLNSQEQLAYDEFKEAYLQFVPKFSTAVDKISKEEFKNAFIAVSLDHAEIFWMDSYNANTTLLGNINTKKVVQLRYAYDEQEALKTKQKIQVNYENILNEASKYETDKEKVKFVHDKLIEMSSYQDYESFEKAEYQSIVSLFDKGEAVCAGYSYAFKFLMDNLGIKAVILEDIHENKPNESHMWNAVYLDGKWYNLDITWDEQLSDSDISYDYFLKGDIEFYMTHKMPENLPKNGAEISALS